MQVKENDNTITQDLNRCVTWQYDGATRLKGIVDLIGDYFAQSSTSFFNALKNTVCDIDSVDDFGLTVWGKILNCQRPFILIEGQSEPQQLSSSLYRNILKAHARLLASHGTVVDYKNYIQLAFNGHFTVHDDCAMGLTFTATASATSEEVALAEQHPDVAFIWPCGVRSSSVQDSGIFSISNSHSLTALDNSYFSQEEQFSPFYFEAAENNTIIYFYSIYSPTDVAPDVHLEYSFDTYTWNEFRKNFSGGVRLNTVGDRIYVRAGKYGNTGFAEIDLSLQKNYYHRFQSSKPIYCHGDIRCLLNRNPNQNRLSILCFSGIFEQSNIISLPELPSLYLNNNCYQGMFLGIETIKIRRNRTSDSDMEWSIPSNVDIPESGDMGKWNRDMFSGVDGYSDIGEIQPGITYFISRKQ